MAVHDDILENFYKLHQATALITDPYGLERHLIEVMKKIVVCNAILIFHNKKESQLLVARNPYNPYQSDAESIVIRYNDPLGADILVHRKSISRVNPQDPVLPLMNAELLSPLNSPDGVLGCLYTSRLSPKGFNQDEIKLIEYAAGLMAFAVERQGWMDHLQALQASNHLWQERYLAFLQSIPFPVFIVDMKKDRIEEANDAAVHLLGGDLGAVLDAPFSETDGLHPDADPGSFDDAVILEVKGRMFQLERAKFSFDDEEKALLLLLPTVHGGQNASGRWLLEFGRACAETVVKGDLQTMLSPLATMIAERFDARYLAVFKTLPKEKPSPLAVFEFEENIKQPRATVVRDLQNDFIQNALTQKSPLFVDNVTQEPAWLPTAKKLKYQSVAATPVVFAKETLGMLVLFCKKPKKWLQESEVVVDAARRLAPLIAALAHRKQHVKNEPPDDLAGKLEALTDAKDIDDAIVQAALLLQPLVPFDYFSVTLMDEDAGEAKPFVLCHADLRERLPAGSGWKAVEGAALGWAKESGASSETAALQNENGGLPYSLPAHISLLLMNGEDYIGNFSVARQKESPFKKDEQSLLREFTRLFSKQLAAKIETMQQQQTE